MQHGRRLHTGMNPRKQGLLGVTVQAGYHSHTLLVGTQMVQSLWEIIQQYLIKLNVQLPSDPSFTSSPVYSREMYTHIHTKACPWVFTAASYVTDPHWKQSKCSSAGERTSCDKPTLWSGYYLATIKNRTYWINNHISSTWMNLKRLVKESKHKRLCVDPTDMRRNSRKGKLSWQRPYQWLLEASMGIEDNFKGHKEAF